MLNIEDTSAYPENNLALFRSGFRPFFLAAALFSIVSMIIWMASYVFAVDFKFLGTTPAIWHAHEMIFGYAMAVIAGFLLTAIKNWTGVEVLRGKALSLLVILWLIARILPLTTVTFPIELIAIVDVLFIFILALVCMRPVLKVKQYKQLGIISKLFLLMLCNVLFYLGLVGFVENGVRWGLYSAIYIIIALVLVMMRRVMPMFIENGVDGEVEIINRNWLDVSSLVLFVCLWILDVFTSQTTLTALVAAVLTILHSLRLFGWYTNKIWSKPLVWILVVAYAAIIFGFILMALKPIFVISPFLYLHAFTVGGIGMVTVGMMSRVILGHTGRDVFNPPPIVFLSLSAMLIGFVVRVIFPLISTDYYIYWIGISQLLWIISFSIFIFVYLTMLVTARVDGRDG